MSKAFTREDHDAPEPRGPVPPASAWSAGSRHPLTPDGAHARRVELEHLQNSELPALLAAPVSEDSLARRRDAEQRIALLQSVLRSANVVPPPADPDLIAFGAEVEVRDHAGAESTYRIVGPQEVDLDRNWIHAASPVARALLGRRRGDTLRGRLPPGLPSLTVLKVRYRPAP